MPDNQIAIIHREDIDGLIPACPFGAQHPRVLVPSCHPEALMKVAYSAGVLAMFCGHCSGPVWGVRVQSRLEVV